MKAVKEVPRIVDYPGDFRYDEKLLNEIEAGKNSLNRDPVWISSARKGLMIKSLDEVSEPDFARYRDYLDGGTFYIIVHPAYSIFFMNWIPNKTAEDTVDAFLSMRQPSFKMRFLQEQERSLRDFLEITAAKKRLVLLILPGNYRDYMDYSYRGTSDEYARFINGVTNGSSSVLYLFSEEPSHGNLPEKSREHLLRFVRSLDPKIILIGGGYLGRCVDEFYREMRASVSEERVAIAGGVTAISPDDVDALNVMGDLMGLNNSSCDITRCDDLHSAPWWRYFRNILLSLFYSKGGLSYPYRGVAGVNSE